jgi:hypothetical protein
MTMLTLASYMKILIEWKYPVYPDSILNKYRTNTKISNTRVKLHRCECVGHSVSIVNEYMTDIYMDKTCTTACPKHSACILFKFDLHAAKHIVNM